MNLDELFDRAASNLPMVPKVVQELIASFDRDDVDVDSIADKVAHDQVLSAKVLRLANSTRMSGGKPVHSIHDAIVLMGFDHLRMLVVASGLTGLKAANPGFNREAFWRRSFHVGAAARFLAALAIPKLDANLAFTCGLMHNIGDLLIHCAFPTEAVTIDKLVDSGADRIKVENMVIGVDLTQVGEGLARRWHFPVEIQQAIRAQRDPLGVQPFSAYAGLIAVADFMVSAFDRKLSDEDLKAVLPQRLLEALGISEANLIARLGDLREVCESDDGMI
jgi:HD-like signal output (HDOD) protein